MKKEETKITSAVAAAIAAMLLANACGQTTLIDDDWQDPLLNNNVLVTTEFTGWTFNSGAYVNRENNATDVPGDSTITFPNQVIQLNGDGTYGEYDISRNWVAIDVYYLRIASSGSRALVIPTKPATRFTPTRNSSGHLSVKKLEGWALQLRNEWI